MTGSHRPQISAASKRFCFTVTVVVFLSVAVFTSNILPLLNRYQPTAWEYAQAPPYKSSGNSMIPMKTNNDGENNNTDIFMRTMLGFFAAGKQISSSDIAATNSEAEKNPTKIDVGTLLEGDEDVVFKEKKDFKDWKPTSQPSASKGVIVFFHVPKTGGSTVGKHIQGASHLGVKYIFSNGLREYKRVEAQIDSWIEKNVTLRRYQVVEFHAGNSPSFVEIHQKLKLWRTQFAKLNVPFFAFTVLREPLSWTVSAYNYFCVKLREKNPCGEGPVSVDHFLDTSLHNPQCKFLTKGWGYKFPNDMRRKMPNKDDCVALYNTILENFDWVGTLEKFDETAEVLTSILGCNVFQNATVQNENSEKEVGLTSLNKTAINHLEDILSLDYELYRKAQDDFQLSDFNLPGISSAF